MARAKNVVIPVIQEIDRMGDPDYTLNDEVWKDFSDQLTDDMYMFYNTGKRHREAGSDQWSHSDFTSHFNSMAQTFKDMSSFVDMFYAGYCRGYNGLDGKFYC